MNPKIVGLCAVCAVALAATGCLFVYQTEEKVRTHEGKIPVKFESPAAAQTFSTTMTERRAQQETLYSRQVNVPFLCSITKTGKLSDAAFYNDEIIACDADRNGIITEAEALAYQHAHGSPPAPIAETGILEQSGEIDCHGGLTEREIYYPRSYMSPPELTLYPGVQAKWMEQRADGFCIKIEGCNGQIRWQARGVPAPVGTPMHASKTVTIQGEGISAIKQ